tara:strand:- start:72580 stop:72756 length:177 start_codon:yes stop_codon:yes gene_type:complete
MLEPWIIEEIRRREDERNRERDARRIQLPLYDEQRRDDRPALTEKEEQPSRGVVVIDL